MTAALLAHAAEGLDAVGLSPGLLLYTVLVLLGLVALALRSSWARPRLLTGAGTADEDRWPTDGAPRPLVIAARATGVAGLVLVLTIAWWGSEQIGANPAPLAVFSAFWTGGLLLSALFGDLWRLVHPFDAVAAVVHRRPSAPAGDEDRRADGGDWWVPGVLLGTFAWLLLAWPEGFQPRSVTAWLTAYVALMVAGGMAAGRAWVRRNEAFAVLFGAVARVSPLGWRDGRPQLRNPLTAIAAHDGDRRTAAVIAVALGATFFDALSSTRWYADLLGIRSTAGYTVANTLGLVWTTGAVVVAWALCARTSDRLAGLTGPAGADVAPVPSEARSVGAAVHPDAVAGPATPASPASPASPATPAAPTAVGLATAFVAVVAGFAVAHDLTSFLVDQQNLLALLSDPFARGWDLLGIVDLATDDTLLPLTVQAWLRLGLVVAALLVTLVVVHDRCLARLGPAVTARASWPVLGAVGLAAVAAMTLLLGG